MRPDSGCIWVLLIAVTASIGTARLARGESPMVPPLSKSVAASDLAAAAKQYVQELEAATVDEKAFSTSADKIKRDANTLAVVALVLAKHDANQQLDNAAAMIEPAQAFAKAKDFTAAKDAVAALRMVIDGKAKAVPAVEWQKSASLGRVMEQVAALNTKLRNSIRRLDPRKTDENARAAAVLTAIGQYIAFDTHEVKDPAQLPKWYEMSAEMRDACAELTSAIRSGDKGTASNAANRVQKNCDACHEVFGQ